MAGGWSRISRRSGGMTSRRIAPVLLALALGACGSSDNRAQTANTQAASATPMSNATVPAARPGGAGQTTDTRPRTTAADDKTDIIPTPPREVLERAWRGIDDPQLAAQLRPDGPFGPADCVVHMGVWREQANARQRAAIDRAAKAWRAALVREYEGDEQSADQMIGSSVNPLADTPPPLRQAAAAWCVAHAPEN